MLRKLGEWAASAGVGFATVALAGTLAMGVDELQHRMRFGEPTAFWRSLAGPATIPADPFMEAVRAAPADGKPRYIGVVTNHANGQRTVVLGEAPPHCEAMREISAGQFEVQRLLEASGDGLKIRQARRAAERARASVEDYCNS